MRPITFATLLVSFALIAAGCGGESPTRAFDSDDQAVASMVAALAGFQSEGLTAMLGDLSGGAVAESLNHGLLRRDVSGRAGLHRASITGREFHTRRTNGVGDDASESITRYFVQSTPGLRVAADEPVAVRTSAEGIHANNSVRIVGTSEGEIVLSKRALPGTTEFAGEIRTAGSPRFGAEFDRRFADVSVTFSWSGLLVRRGSDGLPRLSGSIDVIAGASGARGVVTRSGTLGFNGTDEATLSLGGKEFAIDLGRARLVQ